MVTSEQVARRPLNHVFEAFSGPIRHGYGQPGGCVVRINHLFEWLQIQPTTTYANWLSAEEKKMQSYYFSSQEKLLTCYTLQPNFKAAAHHFTVCIATVALCDTLSADSKYGSAAVCLIVELSDEAHPGEYQLVENSLSLDGKPLQNTLFKQFPSQKALCPGNFVEYRSSPLEGNSRHTWVLQGSKSSLLEGYIVMQNTDTKAKFQIDLPCVALETVGPCIRITAR